VNQARGGGGCLPWIIGAAAFLMIVGLALAALLILPGLSTPTLRPTATAAATLPPSTTVAVEQVAVPPVVGKKQEDAENAIKAARLIVGDTKQENSDSPAGVVIDSSPKAGVKLGAGSKVDLTISKGAETIPLATYTNTPPNAAKDQLEKLGFKVQVIEEYSDTIQAGAVTRTDPLGGPGVTVAKGSLIKLYVSKGKEPVATTAPPATTAAPVPTTEPPAAPTTAPPPPPPTSTPTNPNQTTMPSVVRAKQNEAEKTITQAGLVPQVLTWNENDINQQLAGAPQEVKDAALNNYKQVKKGEVFFTDPGEGIVLNKGTKVTIVVRKDN
jgi:beta-lactam-binding protein with PASTA domain